MDNPSVNMTPIVLFVYNRPSHTKLTVEALLKNSLEAKSMMFIYSDGYKNDTDAPGVAQVRNYIHEIRGFNKVEIIERKKNLGLAKSVISGVSEILNYYDKVIVVEDDVITVPSFLTFMNNSLEYYQPDNKIFSVSGYRYPIKIPGTYNKDVFISKRSSSWGWATWKDRWEKVDWEIKDYKNFTKDKDVQSIFNKGGDDLTGMLVSQIKGKIDSWAIRWAYAHFKNDAYCLFPVKALCKNIGTDSSGTHSATSKKFNVVLRDCGDEIKLTHDLELNEEIMQSIRDFFKPTIFRKILNSIMR